MSEFQKKYNSILITEIVRVCLSFFFFFFIFFLQIMCGYLYLRVEEILKNNVINLAKLDDFHYLEVFLKDFWTQYEV